MNFDEAVALVTKQWAGKTLATLKMEASSEKNGTAFESCRVDGGPRLMLIICLTASDQIGIVERVMDLGEDIPPADWNSLTLVDMALKTARGDGLSYEDLRDPSGKRTSIALCATSPNAVNILQTLFDFP